MPGGNPTPLFSPPDLREKSATKIRKIRKQENIPVYFLFHRKFSSRAVFEIIWSSRAVIFCIKKHSHTHTYSKTTWAFGVCLFFVLGVHKKNAVMRSVLSANRERGRVYRQ